jgi:hypothetical protein
VNVHRQPARRGFASVKLDEPTLVQFVVLSMLVHVLVIVLFGDTSRGGARRGEDLLGTLDVTLRRLSREPGESFRLAPGADIPSPGTALLPRPRSRASAAAPQPPVEQIPAESPVAAEPSLERPETPATPPVEAPTPVEAVPRLNLNGPEEVDRPFRPGAVVPPKIEPAAPQRFEHFTPPKIERELAPPTELPPRELPMAPSAPLERVAPPQMERELAAPAELPPREVPMAPSAPLERVAPPQPERELAPPTELPLREMPLAPSAPLERAAAPAIEHELAPSVELPPRPLPAVPGAPIERVSPPTIERELAPAVELPAPRQAPAAVPPSRSAPGESGVPPAQRAAPPASVPERAPLRPDTLPPLRYRTPQGDEDIFKPRGGAVTPPAIAPRIDLDAARKRAVREMANEGAGSRGVLPFPLPVPPLPEKKTKAAQTMEKAFKPDCRTAYANMGLLAVPALVAGAFDSGSCRW